MATVLAAAAGCTVRPEGYDLEGQDVELVFVHSGDIHSRLIPYDMDVGETDKQLGMDQRNAPFGGIARLSAIVRQERQNNLRFAYVDTGDVFQGAPIFNAFGGEPEFKALTNMGVDVMAIGNHEFDNGATPLVEKATTFANFPLVAANYLLEDSKLLGQAATAQIAQPYTILNLRGLRVGVIGLGNTSAMRGVFKGKNTLGITPLSTREVLQSYVDFLRPQVDLVVVVGHIGYHEDIDYIPRTEGVDIVFGGHLHIALNPPNVIQDCDIAKLRREKDRYSCNTPEKLQEAERGCQSKNTCDAKATPKEVADCQAACRKEAEESCKQLEESAQFAKRRAELDGDIAILEKRGCHPRNVLLVHSGAFLKYVGRLQVTVRQCTRLEQREVCAETDANGRCLKKRPRRCAGADDGRNDWEVIAHSFRLIPVDATLKDDPKMLRLMEPYLLELNRQQRMTEVLGYSANRIRRFGAGSGDSQLGNLVADAMQTRNQVWADFSVTNSLGIRSDVVMGPVDREQLTNVFPFENTITVMYLSGAEVQELMDFITQRSTNRGCQSQAQVAGVTAVLNCGGCPGKGGNECVRVPYNGEACAQRVTVGGTGRPCLEDKDCQPEKTGEICTGQRHPDPAHAGKRRCWMPISCSRSYRMATNDYIAKGGSGFQVLERNTTQKNLGISLRQAAADYILTMSSCAEKPKFNAAAGGKREFVLKPEEEGELYALEDRAQAGDWKGVNAAYAALRKRLADRSAATKDALEKAGLANYLSCTDDCSQAKGSCNGLAYRQVKECSQFKAKNVPQCEALGRVRAALRCVTLPCINAQEDARQQRVFKEGSGSPDPYEPWPE
ncbi:MAG: 5'-nucleotidase C-terminal domain-containing protein [Deltaproteobacteria bacterium]|nr:5'-nucleotidase C-terminal domain-containing protein [Deltaproteobacteria bacterium]